jgi:signal transduction histidine kinase/ligand-binding sensor domain-containing protein
MALALLCVPAPARGDGASSPRSPALSATVWLADDGLPAGDVIAMGQDRDGFLWLGMNPGLVRFDGHQFLPWGTRGEPALPGNRISVVLGTSDGSVWLGYSDHDGVTRIRAGRVDTYSAGRDGIAAGTISALLEDRTGLLWLASAGGLSVFRDGRWKHVGHDVGLPGTEIFSLYEDRRGTLWAGTAAGVYKRPQTHPTFSLVDRGSTFVQGFVEDNDGTIWVTDSQHVLRRLVDGALPTYAEGIRLPTAGWRAIRAHDGAIWVAALGGGLLRIRPTPPGGTPVVERASHQEKIIGSPRAVFQDRQSNIWVGMRGGGLARFSETFFKTDLPLEGLTNDGVRGLATRAAGDVWVATGHHLNRFVGDDRRVFDIAQTTALHVDRTQTLWVSTALGVGRFVDDGRLEMLPLAPGIRIERASAMTTDLSGRLWMCSVDQGLLYSDGGPVAPFMDDPAIAGKPCSALFTDRSGRVWIGLSRSGIATYEAGRFEIHDRTDGAPRGSIVAISQDAAGAVWISTASSLTRFRNGAFVTIGPENGLPGKIVPSMVDDEQGNLWLGVSSGAEIIRFKLREIDAVVADRSHQIRYVLYSVSDGLQGDLHWLSRPGAIRDRNGRLWFVTGRGVAVIDTPLPPTRGDRPPLRIERVLVDGRPLLTEPLADTLPNASSLVFDYAAPSLSAGSKFRFRHRLEGFETEWQDAGARRSVSYASLPAGSYHFRLAATGVDDAAETEAVWSFVIGPPFYQRAWFYALATTLLALACWGYWLLRLRAIRRQFGLIVAERTRVSREIHDTLLQSLGAVGLELEVVARGLDNSQQSTREALRRLRGRVRNCISEARESIWELRSPVQEKPSLADALRDMAEDATSLGAVQIDVVVKGRPVEFGHNIAHHLLRIAQEATNNAIRHGHPNRVTIELDHEGDAVTLRVRDDGCGFTQDTHVTDSTRDQWGLINMQERAERVGGRLDVVSSPGRGTTVEVAFQL